ncbi:MAG: hypothetical protein V4719_08805 [Planctomycetota bacterium]
MKWHRCRAPEVAQRSSQAIIVENLKLMAAVQGCGRKSKQTGQG